MDGGAGAGPPGPFGHFEPGADSHGPRPGRLLGDGGRWGGHRGTVLLALALLLIVALFLAVSCLA